MKDARWLANAIAIVHGWPAGSKGGFFLPTPDYGEIEVKVEIEAANGGLSKEREWDQVILNGVWCGNRHGGHAVVVEMFTGEDRELAERWASDGVDVPRAVAARDAIRVIRQSSS